MEDRRRPGGGGGTGYNNNNNNNNWSNGKSSGNSFNGRSSNSKSGAPAPAGDLPYLSGIARKRPEQEQRAEAMAGKFVKPAPLPLPPAIPQHQQHQHQHRHQQRSSTGSGIVIATPTSSASRSILTPSSARKMIPSPYAEERRKPASSSASSSSTTSTPTLSSSSSSNDEDIDPDDTLRIRLLGHGSSGKVYKVQHRRTQKLYALKIIQEKQEAAVCKQILTEVDILRRADSPYIVRCYGAYEKGGEISFVLEYMDGGSLGSLLDKRKKISERYLAEVAKQVLKGLDYLHRNRIVHRDIKPSNILLGRNQEVKIADFGVSSVLASTMAACNTFVGTCAYMSPERFDPDSHGGNYNGYASDIWALGLTLFECFLGHFPYLSPGQAPDWPSLMFAICFNPPPPPPSDASPEFCDFIVQCLQKDPALRPRAYTLLDHPFITKFDAPAPPKQHQERISSASVPQQPRQSTRGHFWGSFSRAVGSIFS